MGVEFDTRRNFTHPAWAKDWGNRDSLMPFPALIDYTAFPRSDDVLVTLNGAVAAGDTTVTVDALPGAVKADTILRFPDGQYLLVTADAAATDLSLTVAAAEAPIADNAVAVARGTGRVEISDGILVGRTWTEQEAGAPFGPAADGDTTAGECFLLYHPIDDALRNPEGTLYRHGRVVAVDVLPWFATASAAIKAYMRSNYQCIQSTD